MGCLLEGNSSRQRRHEDLVPQLFVRRLEDRCVLNAHAMPLSALAGVVVVNASQPNADRGERIVLSREGNQLDIAVDGKQTAAASLERQADIQIVGDGQRDSFTLTVDAWIIRQPPQPRSPSTTSIGTAR